MSMLSGSTPKKILLVEDDIEYQDIFKTALSPTYDLTVCSNAEDALDKAAQNDFDLMIVDLFLYGESGFTFLEKLADANPSKRIPVPFIVTSGTSDPAVKKKISEMKVTEFLSKPFQEDILLSVVRKCLL